MVADSAQHLGRRYQHQFIEGPRGTQPLDALTNLSSELVKLMALSAVVGLDRVTTEAVAVKGVAGDVAR